MKNFKSWLKENVEDKERAEDMLDDYEERAAMMEYCGALPRDVAEKLAAELVKKKNVAVQRAEQLELTTYPVPDPTSPFIPDWKLDD